MFVENKLSMTAKEEEKIFRKKALIEFGEHIVKLRQIKNINSVKLAELSELTPANISRIEKGKINPTLLSLIKLSHAFGIPMETLMKGYTPE